MSKKLKLWDTRMSSVQFDTKPGSKELTGWVSFRMPMTKAEVTRHVGENCDTYEKGCRCCDAWREWSKTGKAPVIIDRDELFSAITGDER